MTTEEFDSIRTELETIMIRIAAISDRDDISIIGRESCGDALDHIGAAIDALEEATS